MGKPADILEGAQSGATPGIRKVEPARPCQFLTPKGKPVPKELARLDGIIHHYEAQLKAACTRTPRCIYDGGAFGRQVDRNKYISEDLNHFSVKGHAAAAAVAWTTMKQRDMIPRRSSAVPVVSSSGRDGLIAFMRPGTLGEFDLWTVRPDGSRLQRLTESPTNRSDYNPSWSPDGATVLFERRFLNGGTDGDDLYTIRPNRTGLHQLTDCSGNCWGDGEASWSPDGKHIAFGRATGPRTIDHPSKIAVYIANTDGSAIRQLTRPPAGYEDHYPTWSSDRRTIVVQRDTTANPPGPTKLIGVDVASGAERVIFRMPRWAPGAGIPKFAPDGKRILIGFWCIYGDACPASTRTARNATQATIRPNGQGLRPLHLRALADSGTWSPDGHRLAFRCRVGSEPGGPFQLCVSNLDGSHLRRFPWPVDSAHPDWGTHP